MIRLNAFVTLKPYFKEFPTFRIPIVGRPSDCLLLIRRLFDKDVAYGFQYEAHLYFKGNPERTVKTIKEMIEEGFHGKIILGELSELKELSLTPSDISIIKPIVYLAFEKVLESSGFKIPRRNIKKAIPEISDVNRNRGLVLSLFTHKDIVVLRGLRYMLEVRPSGYGIMWIDLYSPPFDLKRQKRLSYKEIRQMGIMEEYYAKSVLSSKERLTTLKKVLNLMNNMLVLKFPDGDQLLFSNDLLQLESLEG